jgi:hypothetical protein
VKQTGRSVSASSVREKKTQQTASQNVNQKTDDAPTTTGGIWVVQCKYSTGGSVGLGAISDVDIPTLIHEYAAAGYLLVSNATLSSPLTEKFEHLQDNCRFGWSFKFWDGDAYLERIRVQPSVWPEYFPTYDWFMKELGNSTQ